MAIENDGKPGQQAKMAAALPPVKSEKSSSVDTWTSSMSSTEESESSMATTTSSDGYPDSPTLGTPRATGTDDTNSDEGKDNWGGERGLLRRTSKILAPPRAQYVATNGGGGLVDDTTMPSIWTYESPILRGGNQTGILQSTPPESPEEEDYHIVPEYSFVRKSSSRSRLGMMMETIDEYSEESESITSRNSPVPSTPTPSNYCRSIPSRETLIAVNRRDGPSKESLAAMEMTNDDHLNMQAYIRAMDFMKETEPDAQLSPVRSMESIDSVLTMSTNLSTVREKSKQELMFARGGVSGKSSRQHSNRRLGSQTSSESICSGLARIPELDMYRTDTDDGRRTMNQLVTSPPRSPPSPRQQSVLYMTIQRWHQEEVKMTRILPYMTCGSFLKKRCPTLSEETRIHLSRVQAPFVDFGFEIHRYCLEYVEGYNMSNIFRKFLECRDKEMSTFRDSGVSGLKGSDVRTSSFDLTPRTDYSESPILGLPNALAIHNNTPPLTQEELQEVHRKQSLSLLQGDSIPLSIPQRSSSKNCHRLPNLDSPSSSTTFEEPSSTPIPCPLPSHPLTPDQQTYLITALNDVIHHISNLFYFLSELKKTSEKAIAPDSFSQHLPTYDPHFRFAQKHLRTLTKQLEPLVPARIDFIITVLNQRGKQIAGIIDGSNSGGGRRRDSWAKGCVGGRVMSGALPCIQQQSPQQQQQFPQTQESPQQQLVQNKQYPPSSSLRPTSSISNSGGNQQQPSRSISLSMRLINHLSSYPALDGITHRSITKLESCINKRLLNSRNTTTAEQNGQQTNGKVNAQLLLFNDGEMNGQTNGEGEKDNNSLEGMSAHLSQLNKKIVNRKKWSGRGEEQGGGCGMRISLIATEEKKEQQQQRPYYRTGEGNELSDKEWKGRVLGSQRGRGGMSRNRGSRMMAGVPREDDEKHWAGEGENYSNVDVVVGNEEKRMMIGIERKKMGVETGKVVEKNSSNMTKDEIRMKEVERSKKAQVETRKKEEVETKKMETENRNKEVVVESRKKVGKLRRWTSCRK
ncbi:hypothetical protein QBC38DRAFT_443377 [Podospora fimiseda]|uniref:Uncharacterized protein n=1 Tax=Podospora fimiseda TaxID=252190 RepID=A0AAN7BQN8_9PEZI|nr:hypothetical protein QBC38DRAFT_443377 [Podospora fimiseda]